MTIILCSILLILAVILLTPVRARVSYQQGELEARLRYGPLNILLFPLKKPEKPEKKKKKPKKKKKKDGKKKTKAKINREQIFYTIEKLPPILGRALKRVGHRIVVTPLHVDVLIAGTDPVDTAVLYGRLATALSAGLPVLQRALRIREQEINLYPDFAGDQMQFAVDAGISIRPWDALVTGVCAGAGLVRWFLGFRKLATPPPKEEKKVETTGEAA
ncbi:MAG: DUF2953 domain-containing protein [Oscillospiraceae bacterium]|nr:DUF2953 domain-containing protein [Oscillospiraceae bacterium]